MVYVTRLVGAVLVAGSMVAATAATADACLINRPTTLRLVRVQPGMAQVAQLDRLGAAVLKAHLNRMGLDAATMAAAGIEPVRAQAILAAAAARFTSVEACKAYMNARPSVSLGEEGSTSGDAASESAPAVPVAPGGATPAAGTSALALELALLTADQLSTLRTIAKNKAWGIPLSLATAERTDAQMGVLRDALAAERIAARDGKAVADSVQEVLDVERGQAAVGLIQSRVSSNVFEIDQLIFAATTPGR